MPLTIISPKEEVQEIASKGGKASHSGGFASMDPDKQVSHRNPEYWWCVLTVHSARSPLREAKPPAVRSRRAARQPGRLDVRVVRLRDLNVDLGEEYSA
jgi:hypothetical protein